LSTPWKAASELRAPSSNPLDGRDEPHRYVKIQFVGNGCIIMDWLIGDQFGRRKLIAFPGQRNFVFMKSQWATSKQFAGSHPDRFYFVEVAVLDRLLIEPEIGIPRLAEQRVNGLASRGIAARTRAWTRAATFEGD
jgi:hypothetical protein